MGAYHGVIKEAVSKKLLQRKTNQIRNWTGHYLQSQAQELLGAAESPLALAAAFALGTLTSFFPIPILDSLLAVGLTVRFERLNKAAIFAARVVWNDLLVVPLYGPGFKLGQLVLTAVLDTQENQAADHPYFWSLLSFIIGAALLAMVAAALGFLIVFLIAAAYRKKTTIVKLIFICKTKSKTTSNISLSNQTRMVKEPVGHM